MEQGLYWRDNARRACSGTVSVCVTLSSWRPTISPLQSAPSCLRGCSPATVVLTGRDQRPTMVVFSDARWFVMSVSAGKKVARPGPSDDTAAASADGWGVLTGQSEPQMPALLNYVRQGRCALFVGAGLSAGAGLPTWRSLMERMIDKAAPFAVTAEQRAALEKQVKQLPKHFGQAVENPLAQNEIVPFFAKVLGLVRAQGLFGSSGGIDLFYSTAFGQALRRIDKDSASKRELNELVDGGKYADLAGYCRDLLGREVFHEELRAALRVAGDIPGTHRAIVDTPYACIVTTNFDTLLEDAYARWSPRGVPKAPTGAELAQQGTLLFDETFFILKAHGDLDDERSIVLTSEDYRRVVHSSPAFQATMGGILQRYALLFVGYSLSDINFRLLLDNQLTIFNEYVPPRYALMEGVGAAEREILWRTAKLRVISYLKGQHDLVGRLLRSLAPAAPVLVVADQPAPPVLTRMARPSPLDRIEIEIRSTGEGLALQMNEVTADGRTRHSWGGGCRWPQWSLLKEALQRVMGDQSTAELMQVNAIGSELQRAWPDELVQRLEAASEKLPVLLALDAATETVPWEWVIVRGSPLCLRNPVVRRPSGISDRSRGLRLAGKPLRALVIGDAGLGVGDQYSSPLPGAMQEAERIEKLLTTDDRAHVLVLNRENAVYERLMREVENGEYDIIHFAGFAGHDQGEGVLMLWDGKVTSSELASILNRRPPSLLVLNSHYTAFAPCGIFDNAELPGSPSRPPGMDRPLPKPMGFMGLASRSGVGAFVGNFSGSLLDDGASLFAITFYETLLRGQNFANALHQARKATTNVNNLTGLSYVGSGYAGLDFSHVVSGRR